MKKIKYLLFMLVLLMSFGINVVNAAKLEYSDTEQIDKENLKLCEYTITIKQQQKSGLVKDDAQIYYNYDSENIILVYNYSYDSTRATYSHLGHIYSYIDMSLKKFYIPDTTFDNLMNGVCPKYFYYEDTGGSSEFCFDDKGKYCQNNGEKLNAGTDFNWTTSTELIYNYQEHIKNYFNNTYTQMAPIISSCEDLKKLSSSKTIKNQIINDFQTNFLNGNSIPYFIENSDVFLEGMDQIVKDNVNVINDYAKNNTCNLSDDEYEQLIKEINDQVDDAKNSMSSSDKNILPGLSDFGGKFNCSDVPDTMEFIKQIFKIIKIAAPILVIVYGTLDYAKVVFGDKEDDLKKSNVRFIKRLIAAVIIFLLPYFIDLLLTIFGFDSSCRLTDIFG